MKTVGITPENKNNLDLDSPEDENHHRDRDDLSMTVSTLSHILETIGTTHAIALHLEMLVAPMLRDSDASS